MQSSLDSLLPQEAVSIASNGENAVTDDMGELWEVLKCIKRGRQIILY